MLDENFKIGKSLQSALDPIVDNDDYLELLDTESPRFYFETTKNVGDRLVTSIDDQKVKIDDWYLSLGENEEVDPKNEKVLSEEDSYLSNQQIKHKNQTESHGQNSLQNVADFFPEKHHESDLDFSEKSYENFVTENISSGTEGEVDIDNYEFEDLEYQNIEHVLTKTPAKLFELDYSHEQEVVY